MVYHYTKRATLARLLANKGPAIYVVYLNRYFCYTSMILFSSHFCDRVAVKALLDSGATGLFIDTAFTKKKGFKMEKLKNLLLVRNVDGTENVRGAIMHQVKCNMFFKRHVERVRMDICNLGKTEVILGMPWLAAYNPEIDWEKREVRIVMTWQNG